ncbi:MAG TPA: adenylate/guanylate cyclase domain-containing protein [Actinomycetota bacterium]
MEASETRYALNGDVHVAYRTFGEGPIDLVFASNWFTNVEIMPEHPPGRAWTEQLASLGRVIFYDLPGTGASDPVSLESFPTLEQWTDSITAVLDAVGSSQAVLLAVDVAFPTAALFAATYPKRTRALIALAGWARALRADDYPMGLPRESWEHGLEVASSMWGMGEWQHAINPDLSWNEDARRMWGRFERLTASPNTFRRMARLSMQLDVRDILPSIRVPTLVLHHTNDRLVSVEAGRYIAEHVPGARFVELLGNNHYLFVEPGWRRCFEEISEFITGARPAPIEDDRILATVLFTDIVGSTEKAAQMGDREWRALLDAHDAIVRSQLARFRGREVKTVGDGFLVTFDGPQRAIRCAQAIRDSVGSLGLEMRAGLHTGECEVRGEDVGGLAVHIGARISALAEPGEILVSGTLADLVVGSGLGFDDRGTRELKGVPGRWRLHAVAG